MATSNGFKGNKAALPSKPCLVCGRDMVWRKSWAKNWADVKYCSDACRARKNGIDNKPAANRTPP
jgi:hypothetical protein